MSAYEREAALVEAIKIMARRLAEAEARVAELEAESKRDGERAADLMIHHMRAAQAAEAREAKLREALETVAQEIAIPVPTWKNGINFKKLYERWRKVARRSHDRTELHLQSSGGGAVMGDPTRDPLALAMFAAWLNVPADKIPPEYKQHTCGATMTAWQRVGQAAVAFTDQALAARTEAAEAREAKLREALATYKKTFCEGFCHDDTWSDAGHHHPDFQRDCSGCLAASILLQTTAPQETKP
jgi:hypothetical protein